MNFKDVWYFPKGYPSPDRVLLEKKLDQKSARWASSSLGVFDDASLCYLNYVNSK